MIDFELPEDVKDVRHRVAKFVDDVVLPAEVSIGSRPWFDIVADLQEQARAAELWCPFLPPEWGGMGLGHLANAIVQVELGRSFTSLAAWALNTAGPQDATMLTLLKFGTDQQKEQYLRPLAAGKIRLCFSMTERAAGADATAMRTSAVLEDGQWVLNGEKWYSSSASISQLALIMARTDTDGPRHKQFSTFLVDLPNPGYRIIRDIPTMTEPFMKNYPGENRGGGHAEVAIENLRIPQDNLLGGRGEGFAMGQFRLGYGRLRHGMYSIAKAQAALDLAAARVTERSTFGKLLSDRQGVQWMLADCAEQLYVARLMVLHLAYKMENDLDITQENSIAKNYIARMLHNVVDTSLQLHGALGISMDTPLAQWYVDARTKRVVDGPDEVHKWRVGSNVIKAYKRDGTTAAAAGGDLV